MRAASASEGPRGRGTSSCPGSPDGVLPGAAGRWTAGPARRAGPKTVRNVHGVLHAALRDAVRWGYLARNVADAADLPKGMTPQMRVWSPKQLRAFLAHVRAGELYAAWMLFTTTGMRRGEVAGLRWADVDLDTGRASPRRPRVVVNYDVVVSEPKTAKGRRSLALDPATVAVLREHRTRQVEQRLAVGPGWHDSGLVFTWPDGRAIHPQRFSNWFEQHPRGRAAKDPATRRPPQLRHRRAGRRHPRRSSANGSATRPSPSPWTPTATSCPAWTNSWPAPLPA
jgi:integrase